MCVFLSARLCWIRSSSGSFMRCQQLTFVANFIIIKCSFLNFSSSISIDAVSSSRLVENSLFTSGIRQAFSLVIYRPKSVHFVSPKYSCTSISCLLLYKRKINIYFCVYLITMFDFVLLFFCNNDNKNK